MTTIYRKTISALLLFMPLTVLAGPVDETTARQQAQAFMQQRGMAVSNVPLRMAKSRRAPGVANSTTPHYYVFNIGATDGFVIVSGDDRTPAILGYADNGTIDEEIIPDGLRYLLDGYAEQMAWLDENDGSDGEYKPNRANVVRSPITPLIATRWDQEAPYNKLCPEISDELTVTGCVATTLAQLMYYHQWPTAETPVFDSYSIKTKNKEEEDTTVIVPALSATTFSWSDMALTYTDNDTGDAADAVAELMRYCGSALRMRYGLSSNGGSSSYSESIPYALKACFGYDGGVHHAYRANYSYADWVSLIYSELADGRPVALGGQATGGGHSFVCDGYDTDDYFHINWGWGGVSNGYFRLSLLNPYEQGIGGSSTLDGFSFSQDAVIGIQPPVEGTKDYCLSLEGLWLGSDGQYKSSKTFVRDSETGYFTDISLYFLVFNYMQDSHDFDFAVQLVDGNDNLVQELYKLENSTMGWNDNVGGTITGIAIPSTVADGVYYIKVFSRLHDTTDWQECFDGEAYQLTAIIDGDNLTISVPITDTVLPTAVTFTVNGDLVKGHEQEVIASITGGSADYHGNVVLRVSGSPVMGKTLDIPAGQTVDAHFTFIPTTAGSKKLSLYDRKSGGKEIGTDSEAVIITESDATDVLDLSFSATIDNLSSSGQLYGNALRATVTVSNPSTTNSYAGQLNCSVRKWTSIDNDDNTTIWSWESIGVTSYPLIVDKEGTTTVSIARDGLETGVLYSARITYRNSEKKGNVGEGIHLGLDENGIGSLSVTNGYSLGNAAGVTTIYEPATTIDAGDACFADLRGLGTLSDVTVTPSSNPNCLYLLAEAATIPESLSECNVVRGSEAEHLTLTDGYDFYSPIDFTARNASYTRTFTLAAAGSSGWNTLMLPFTATTVTCEGIGTVDWFRSADDTGKNFWLRAFTADGAGTVTFDYAQEIAANTPYLIAVPDDRFGSSWQMTGRAVTFSAENTSFAATKTMSVSGNHFKFCGSTTETSLSDVYLLNAKGSRFVKASTATDVAAFRAWFTPVSISSLSRSALSIVSPDATGIEAVHSSQGTVHNAVYDLKGRKVAESDTQDALQKQLRKGLYIHNGKKIVVE